MKSFFKLVSSAFLGILLFANITAFAQEENSAAVQIIHNAVDPVLESVDIYLNGDVLLEDFGFREATEFLSVPSNTALAIVITPAGASINDGLIFNFDDGLPTDARVALVANGVLADDEFSANPDGRNINADLFVVADLEETASADDEVLLTVFHGATDAPSVDIAARDVGVLIPNAAYGDSAACSCIHARYSCRRYQHNCCSI